MSCSLCESECESGTPPFLFAKRYLCNQCFASAKKLFSLTNKLHVANQNSPSTNKKTLEHAFAAVNELYTLSKELAGALTNSLHCDILVKPGDHGLGIPAIPAHKVILAIRSGILKNMLETDGCKAPAGDSITLPDLNKEELQAFLQFLYSGQLAQELVEEHCYSLLRAAHKYLVPSLENLCLRSICKSLGRNNALEVLEFTGNYSLDFVTDAAIDLIVEKERDIILSSEFEAFANRNPGLSLRVTRRFLKKFNNLAALINSEHLIGFQ